MKTLLAVYYYDERGRLIGESFTADAVCNWCLAAKLIAAHQQLLQVHVKVYSK